MGKQNGFVALAFDSVMREKRAGSTIAIAVGGLVVFTAVIHDFGCAAPHLGAYVAQRSSDADVEVADNAAETGEVGYGRAGMTVAIDPITGELRAPTAQERQALFAGQAEAQALNTSTDGLQQVLMPDGHTVGVDLQGRFMSHSIAKVMQDGSVRTGCVTTRKEAEGFLGTSPTTEKEGDHE